MSSGIAPVPLEVAAKGQCTELDAGGARGVNSPSRWWPEVAEDLARVVALPGLAGMLGRVLLVEGDEQVDQLAADGLDAEQVGQLGQLDEPLRVPGRPVVVGSVDDAEHAMMGLARLVQQVADLPQCLGHLGLPSAP